MKKTLTCLTTKKFIAAAYYKQCSTSNFI